jgi:hypothetical protein
LHVAAARHSKVKNDQQTFNLPDDKSLACGTLFMHPMKIHFPRLTHDARRSQLTDWMQYFLLSYKRTGEAAILGSGGGGSSSSSR